jgi:hypothetical protein
METRLESILKNFVYFGVKSKLIAVKKLKIKMRPEKAQ